MVVKMSSSQETQDPRAELDTLIAGFQKKEISLSGEKGYWLSKKTSRRMDSLIEQLPTDTLAQRDEVKLLRQHCVDWKVSHDALSGALDVAKSELKETRAELSSAQTAFEALMEDRDTLQTQIAAESAPIKAELHEVQLQNSNLKKQLESSRRTASDPDEVQLLGDKLSASVARAKSLSTNLQTMNSMNEASKAACKESKELVTRLNDKVQKLQVQYSEALSGRVEAGILGIPNAPLPPPRVEIVVSSGLERMLGKTALKYLREAVVISEANVRERAHKLLMMLNTAPKTKKLQGFLGVVKAALAFINVTTRSKSMVLAGWLHGLLQDFSHWSLKTASWYRCELEKLIERSKVNLSKRVSFAKTQEEKNESTITDKFFLFIDKHVLGTGKLWYNKFIAKPCSKVLKASKLFVRKTFGLTVRTFKSWYSYGHGWFYKPKPCHKDTKGKGKATWSQIVMWDAEEEEKLLRELPPEPDTD